MNHRPGSSLGLRVLCLAALAIWSSASPLHAQTQPPGYRAIPLRNASAVEVAPRLRETLAGMGTKVQVFVDPQENQILVSGSEEAQRIAIQALQTLDQPVADPLTLSKRASEVRGYRVVSGDLQTAAVTLTQMFPPSGGTRVVIDDRTQQLIVVATPEVHRAVEARMQSGNLAQLRDAGAVTANGSVYQLRRLKWKEFEEELQYLWGGRLNIAGSPTGELANISLPGPDGPIPVMQIDRTRDRITFLGNAQTAATWSVFVQSLDAPNPGESVTQLVSLRNAEPDKVKNAIDLLHAAAPKKPGEASAAFPITRDSTRRRTSSDLVAMIFQQPAAAPAAAPQPPAAAPAQPATPAAPAQPGEKPATPGADLEEGGFFGPVQIDIFLDTLIIRGNKRDVERVKRVIADIEAIAEKTKPIFEVYHLQHVNSEAIQLLVVDLYQEILAQRQGQVSIRALVEPNALLLIGREESVAVVKDLVQRLDQPSPPASKFEVIRLMNVSAVDVEQTVRNFFVAQPGQAGVAGQAAGVPRAGLGTRVGIISDYRTNSLIVQAAPRDLEEVRRFIQSIDIDTPSARSQLRIFRLRNALAQDLATVLQSAFSGQQQVQPGQAGVVQAPGGAAAAIQTRLPSPSLTLETIDQATGKHVVGGILSDVVVTANASMNALIVRAPPKSMELVAALIDQLDRLPQLDSQIKVFTIENGDATLINTMLQGLFGQPANAGQGGVVGGIGAFNQQALAATTGGDTSLVPLRFVVDLRTNSIIATGSSDDLLVVNAIITRLDQSVSAKLIVVRLRNTQSDAVAAALTTYLTNQQTRIQQQLLTQGVISAFDSVEREVFVVSEAITNSLIISASPKYESEIMRVVKELDVRAPSVMVHVLIAEVLLDDFYEFGAEFGLQDSLVYSRGIASGANTSIPGFNFASSPVSLYPNLNTFGRENVGGQSLSNFALGRSNTTLGFGGLVLSAASESISILIRALENENRLQVLSRPTIMTMHNQPGYVQVGSNVARIAGTAATQGVVTLNTTDVPTGIILSILPLINDDGVVVMGVEAERSALGSLSDGTVIGTDANGNALIVPPVNITRASTTISAMDGQTVVFAGLITKDRQVTSRRIPYLSDVPLLGDLFQYEQDRERRSELLIVMTPYIIRDEQDAEIAKIRESERMSWCLADILDVSGDIGVQAGNCLFCKTDPPTIHPDENPTGHVPVMAGKDKAAQPEQAFHREGMLMPVPQPGQTNPGFEPAQPYSDAARLQRPYVPQDPRLLPATGTQPPSTQVFSVAPATFQPVPVKRLPAPN